MYTLVVIAVSLSLALICRGASAPGGESEKLIGWRGETYDPDALWDPLNLTASQPDAIPLPASRSWVEAIR